VPRYIYPSTAKLFIPGESQGGKGCFDSGISIFGFPNFDFCPDYLRVEYFSE